MAIVALISAMVLAVILDVVASAFRANFIVNVADLVGGLRDAALYTGELIAEIVVQRLCRRPGCCCWWGNPVARHNPGRWEAIEVADPTAREEDDREEGPEGVAGQKYRALGGSRPTAPHGRGQRSEVRRSRNKAAAGAQGPVASRCDP